MSNVTGSVLTLILGVIVGDVCNGLNVFGTRVGFLWLLRAHRSGDTAA